jgi:hypothetical protein
MPRAPKTLLDEARQVVELASKAGKREWRRNNAIEDLYRRFQSHSGYDYPMYELQQDYKWLDERDAAMDAYYQARQLWERLRDRDYEIGDAIRRYEYAKEQKQERLERLLKEQEEWRQDDELRNRNPKFYEMKGRSFDWNIPKLRDEIDNFEVPPAGWRGY